MMTIVKSKLVPVLIFSLGCIVSVPSMAGIHINNIGIGIGLGAGPGYWDGYGYGPGYYGRGGYYYSAPNVVINVPVQRYYVRPPCENVEVCDPYGQCWLEQYCG